MSYRLVRYSHNQLDDLFKLAPFSVGFDGMFDRLLTNTYNTSTTYPPYDIVKVDATSFQMCGPVPEPLKEASYVSRLTHLVSPLTHLSL